jgi:hypothetical protein
MPFEVLFPPGFFDGTLTILPHEHGGVPPSTIIRTDQSWGINVDWTTTGAATGMIAGQWHLHVYLESIGPGNDLDLVDPADHVIPLTPGPSPINYQVHFDVPANVVAIPPGDTRSRPYQLAVALTYIEPNGTPGSIAAIEMGSILQFYNP